MWQRYQHDDRARCTAQYPVSRAVSGTATVPRGVTVMLAAISLVLTACGPKASPPNAPQPNAAASDASDASSRSDDRYSLYDLPSRWRDQQGTERRLRTLAGAPQVVALVYTDCASTCPLIVSAMQRVERRSDASVGFVLVSLNPERDTPETLAHYAHLHGLSSRWTLLNGSDPDVQALVAALGLRFRRFSKTDFAHDNTLTVLDDEGAIVSQLNGVDVVEPTVRALTTISRNH